MNCNNCHDQLADYLGNELTPTDRAAFEEHLRSCPACLATVSQLSGAQDVIRSLAGPLESAEARAQAAPHPAAPHVIVPRPRVVSRLAIAAGLLLAFLAGYLVGVPRHPAPLSDPTASHQPERPTRPVPPTSMPRVAQDYLAATRAAPTAGSFGWALLSVAKR